MRALMMGSTGVMKRPRSLFAVLLQSLVLAACTDSAADENGTSGEDSGADADADSGGPQVCGDGVVQGDEQCDGGTACDERCRIPGTVQWTQEVEATVRDLAFGTQGLFVCSSGLAVFDPDDRSITPVGGLPGETCERVAVASDGTFAALAWPEGGFAESIGIAVYDDDTTVRWEVPALALNEETFNRPALELAADGDVVVAGTRQPDFFSALHVVQFDASGAEAWTYTHTGVTESRAGAVALAPNGQVVVGGMQFPPANGGAALLLVIDEGESLYVTNEDFTQDGIDTAADLELTDDGTIVVAGVRDQNPYIAAFAPPSHEVLWSRNLADDRNGYEPALAAHPSGHIAVAARAADSWSVELFDSNGDAVWTYSVESEGGGHAALAVDGAGDLYVGFGGEITRIAAPAVPGS